MRAALSQEDLAGRLGLPRSQIARWERDAVEPGFSTLRRALRACGFDLSPALIPYEADLARDERLRQLQLQSPQERLRRHGRPSSGRMSSRKPTPTFDPYAILRELERERVGYVVIGALARVIQGSDELTRGVDLTPSLRASNLERPERCLGTPTKTTDGRPLFLAGADPAREPLITIDSDHGEIKLALEPAGTHGYDDLRRAPGASTSARASARKSPTQATSSGCSMTLGRETDAPKIETMRRIIELDRGLGLEL